MVLASLNKEKLSSDQYLNLPIIMLIELNLWRVIISHDDMFDVNGMN